MAWIIEVHLLLLAIGCKYIREPRCLASCTLLLVSCDLGRLLRIAARLDHCVADGPHGRASVALAPLMSGAGRALRLRVRYLVHHQGEAHVSAHVIGRRV